MFRSIEPTTFVRKHYVQTVITVLIIVQNCFECKQMHSTSRVEFVAFH